MQVGLGTFTSRKKRLRSSLMSFWNEKFFHFRSLRRLRQRRYVISCGAMITNNNTPGKITSAYMCVEGEEEGSDNGGWKKFKFVTFTGIIWGDKSQQFRKLNFLFTQIRFFCAASSLLTRPPLKLLMTYQEASAAFAFSMLYPKLFTSAAWSHFVNLSDEREGESR